MNHAILHAMARATVYLVAAQNGARADDSGIEL